MTTPVANAITAYLNTARGAGPGLEAPGGAPGANFADLVKDAADNAIAAGRAAEKASMAVVDGSPDVAEVVTALADAELALQTVVAIRDEVISAYQEILRMPI